MCRPARNAGFYAAQGTPAYADGPGLPSMAYGPNEHIDLRRITSTAAIYALTGLALLQA